MLIDNSFFIFSYLNISPKSGPKWLLHQNLIFIASSRKYHKTINNEDKIIKIVCKDLEECVLFRYVIIEQVLNILTGNIFCWKLKIKLSFLGKLVVKEIWCEKCYFLKPYFVQKYV